MKLPSIILNLRLPIRRRKNHNLLMNQWLRKQEQRTAHQQQAQRTISTPKKEHNSMEQNNK